MPPGERKETHCLIGHVHTVFQTVNGNEPVLGGNRVPGAVCFQPVEAKALYEAVFQSLRLSPSLPFRRQFLWQVCGDIWKHRWDRIGSQARATPGNFHSFAVDYVRVAANNESFVEMGSTDDGVLLEWLVSSWDRVLPSQTALDVVGIGKEEGFSLFFFLQKLTTAWCTQEQRSVFCHCGSLDLWGNCFWKSTTKTNTCGDTNQPFQAWRLQQASQSRRACHLSSSWNTRALPHTAQAARCRHLPLLATVPRSQV